MQFYNWAMRGASVILFVAALISLFGGAVPFFLMIDQSAANLYRDSGANQNWMIVQAIVSGVSNAVWPLFGAALLWRADKYLAGKREAAE